MAIVVLATNILNSIFTKSVINFSLDFGGSWWILPSFCFPLSCVTYVDRPIERKLSNQQIASPPPNYEDVTRDGQDNLHADR